MAAVISSVLGQNQIFVTTGNITSAQIKAVLDTPIPIIPAPGAGKIIFVQSAIFKYKFGGIAYGADSYLALQYGSDNAPWASNIIAANFMGAADKVVNLITWIGNGLNQDANASQLTASIVNMPVTLSSEANFTLGNGTLTYNVWYSIVNVP